MMKKLLLTLLISITTLTYSQAPQEISYQGVARNITGSVLPNQTIGIKLDLHQGSAVGTVVFSESHNKTTNAFGLFTLGIGSSNGTAFTAINWANGPYFLEVSMDPAGGTAYTSVGTQQFMSVPYALYAQTSGNATPTPTITINAPNTVTSVAGSYSITVPAQTLSLNSNSLSISNGNTVILPTGTTYSAGNGIDITGGVISNTAVASSSTTVISGNNITLNQSGSTYTVNAPSYSLAQTGNNIDLLQNGTSIGTATLPVVTSYSAGNGIDITGNTISAINPTITSTGIAVVTPTTGNTFNINVPAPALGYNNATNVLSLTQGTTVTTATLVGTGTNTTSIVGTGLATVTPTTGSTFTVSVPNPTITIASGSLSISNGNSVAIPSPSLTVNSNSLTINGPGGNTVILPTASTTSLTQGTNVTVAGSAPSYTVSSVTPTLNVVGGTLSGSYPIQTLTIPASSLTTLTQSTGILVTGTAPNYTLSSPNQSLTINSNSLSITGGNTITLPPSVINGTGTGIATVTTTANNFTVNVPTPAYTAATGVLSFGGTNTVVVTPTLSLTGTTLTSGAATNSVNLATLPGLWTAPTATTVVTTNSTSLVGIGNNAPIHKLDVIANTTALAAIHGYNTGSGAASTGVFGDHSSNGIGVYGQSVSGQGIWGKSTSNAGVYGESVSGDAGKFLMTGTGPSYGIQVNTSGSGAALYAKSSHASALAARFDGNAIITHTSTSASPHISIISPTINDFGRVKFSNTGSTRYFSLEARNNSGGAADAFNIAHNNGINEKQVFLINGNRNVFINNLNLPLTTFHVMTSSATAGGGIAAEGFGEEGAINILRNNQTSGTLRVPVIAADLLGRINFSGYNGTTFNQGAEINAMATEAHTGSAGGTDMYFKVTPGGTIVAQHIFKMANDGVVTVNPNNSFNKTLLDVKGRLRVDSSLTMAAYSTPPNTSFPNEGRIYFDRPTNKFKVSENNGAYVDLIPAGGSPWVQGAGTVTLSVSSSSVGIGTPTPNSPFQVLNYVSFENNGSNTSLGFNTGTGISPNNYYNTMVGASAGQAVGTGSSFANTFMGYQSGLSNSNGSSNTFIGSEAGKANTASNNTYLGANAGRLSTTGSANVFLGANSGAVNTIGTSNVFLGFDAGKSNVTGTDNTFVGRNSGPANTTGSSNIFIGSSTGNLSATGSFNVFLGNSAGNNTTNGNSNVFIGYQTGVNNTTGQSNTFIGRGADLFSATQYTNATAIGFNAKVNTNDALVLGNGTKVGIGITTPTAQLQVVSSGSLIAGRFEILSATNTADAVFVENDGRGAAIKAVSGPTVTGSSNVAMWLEAGHLKTTGTAPTYTLPLNAAAINGNDIVGTALLTLSASTTVNQNMVTIFFNKPYSVAPNVMLYCNNALAFNANAYVTGTTTTSFTITFASSVPAAAYSFKYLVIE